VAEYLIIAGLSGAGQSTAADTMEDLGWFVIDNLPPSLIGKVRDLVGRPGSDLRRVALVGGRGGTQDVDELAAAVADLRRTGAAVRVLFLTATDDVLVRRFEGTRRRHPVPAATVGEGIAAERVALEPLQAGADVVVDTSELNVHQLRARLVELFGGRPGAGLQTSVVSFGYSHGLPRDVDLVLDCRFLPNPHWVDELRSLTGLDEHVRDYVLGQPQTREFLAKLDDLLGLLLPGYEREGKSYLSVAVGCTGGRHRSVVLAEELARRMAGHGFPPAVSHRDLGR